MGNNEHTIVYLIGMGPGNSDCLTREAVQAVSQATVCIGASACLRSGRASVKKMGATRSRHFIMRIRQKKLQN